MRSNTHEEFHLQHCVPALRSRRPDALADREQAFLARYVELAGETTSIRACTILTLIRHIALSRQLPDRRPFTEPLMMLGERLLGIG